MIDSCAFGTMTINGKPYRSDLIIYPDGRVTDGWWRKKGHRFTLDDMRALVDDAPEIIVAGTGMNAMVKLEPDLTETLAARGIRLIPAPTADAVTLFNKMRRQHRTGGCFHLTC